MEIVERTVSDVTVLDLKGKMTLGEGDELLKDKISGMRAQDVRVALCYREDGSFAMDVGTFEAVVRPG